MASYDRNIGMWVATAPDGSRLGTFATQAEAVAAEQAGAAKVGTNDGREFANVTNTAMAQGGSAGGGTMGFTGANANRRSMIGTQQMQVEDAALAQSRLQRAEADRVARTPYGTPVAQGGTAAFSGAGPNPVSKTFVSGDGGGGAVRGDQTVSGSTLGITNRAAGNAAATNLDARIAATGAHVTGGDPNAAALGAVGRDQYGNPVAGAPGDPTGQANNIDSALGEAIDYTMGDNDTQGIIDRVDDIISGATLERDVAQKGNIDRALQAQQGVIDRVLSQESDARIVAEQMAAEQRGQALSARGGAAAQQQAMSQVAANAPAMQTAAARSAVQETTQRNALAGQVAGQMGQVAIGSEQNDIAIQQANAGMADSFAKMVSTLGGVELNLNAQDRHKVGQMVFDFQMLTQNTDLGWAKLSNEEKGQILDYMLGKYQVDETTAANIRMTAMNNEESFLDQLGKLGSLVPG